MKDFIIPTINNYLEDIGIKKVVNEQSPEIQ
jgi:hypothetical protein